MKKNLFSIWIMLLVVSCKSTKNQSTPTEVTPSEPIVKEAPSTPDKNPSVPNEAVNKNLATLSRLEMDHNNINRTFKTAQIISSVHYQDANYNQSVKADIRIEQGKQILITVKALMINIAKIYITPDRVSYYEIIRGTHYDGDFTFLTKMLGTPLTYTQVENIFLGKAIFSINDPSMQLTTTSTTYQVDKKVRDFIVSIFLNANAELKSEIIRNKEKVYANLEYGQFQTIKGVVLPKKWSFHTKQIHTLQMELEYDKIELNNNLNFKYEIPSGSKAVKF